MKKVCAWCKQVIFDDPNTDPQAPVSHGICASCRLDLHDEISGNDRPGTILLPTADLLRPIGD